MIVSGYRLIFCTLVVALAASCQSNGESVTDWAVHYDRPDDAGWGASLNLPDLLISSSGRYEFLDHVQALGQCERVQRRLSEEQMSTLESTLFPVLSRYELDPRILSACTASHDLTSRYLFRYRLSSGRVAEFEIGLQSSWCDPEGQHNDVKALEGLLRRLALTLEPNCV